ncbi:hypothetical protein SLS55_007384 [Diplodia seriata]|uniref:Uncharacterized protein n=1 Tax=Diplodia seriata TaxID=420778 RepID=A0ABR3CD59_9PEZI
MYVHSTISKDTVYLIKGTIGEKVTTVQMDWCLWRNRGIEIRKLSEAEYLKQVSKEAVTPTRTVKIGEMAGISEDIKPTHRIGL